MERALVIVKPDGVERNLIGNVVARFEAAGLKVTAAKMLFPDAKKTGMHYAEDEAWLLSVGKKAKKSYLDSGIEIKESERAIGMSIRSRLITEFMRGPVFAFVLEGNAANEISRKLAGSTEPRSADPSTIRGAYSTDSYALADAEKRPVRNIIHVSENQEAAEREIKIWFSPAEIFKRV